MRRTVKNKSSTDQHCPVDIEIYLSKNIKTQPIKSFDEIINEI